MNLDFVSKAVSKDKARFNLTSVYRDKTALVATDGTRAHVVRNLTHSEPHFLDGREFREGDFPDYTMILPEHDLLGHFVVNGHSLKSLKKFAGLVKSIDRTLAVKLETCQQRGLCISYYKANEADLKFWLDTNFSKPIFPSNVGLNIEFLIDAIEVPVKANPKELLQFDVYSNPEELEPVKIQHKNLEAIIMPARLY